LGAALLKQSKNGGFVRSAARRCAFAPMRTSLRDFLKRRVARAMRDRCHCFLLWGHNWPLSIGSGPKKGLHSKIIPVTCLRPIAAGEALKWKQNSVYSAGF